MAIRTISFDGVIVGGGGAGGGRGRPGGGAGGAGGAGFAAGTAVEFVSTASTFLRVTRFFGAGASVVTGSTSAATALVLAVLVAVFFTARLRAGASVSSDCFLLIRVEMGERCWLGFTKRVDRGFRRRLRSW